jgi:uncharacterized protein YndB with AHSA1/START domain
MDYAETPAFACSHDGAAIETSRLYRQPPEKLWGALTIPQRFDWTGVQWQGGEAPLDFGARVDFRFADTGLESRGRVLRCEPCGLLEFSVFDNFPPGGVVTWTLSPEAGGCRLGLRHAFGGLEDAPRMGAGWAQLLDRLGGGLGEHEPPATIQSWQAMRDRVAAVFPALATRDGRAIILDGVPALQFERQLRHAPDVVWPALTEPAALARWMQAEATVEPRLGGRFHMIFQGGPHRTDGRIIQWEPPRLLEFTWSERGAGEASRVRFALRPIDGGCVLTLTHLLGGPGDMADYASGWHWHLDCLQDALLGETCPFDTARWAALRAIYAAILAGAGHG